MKICVLAVVLALGCGSSKETAPAAGSGSAEARPTVTDPIGFCERARRMMVVRRKCFPEDTSLKMGMDELAELVGSAPAAPDARRRVAVDCAVRLDSMMRVQQPPMCPLDVTDSERTELFAFLTAWYSERTAVPATPDAAANAAVAKIAAQRDAACECKNGDCARTLITEIGASVAGLLDSVPKEATAAAAKMSDEALRCKQRIIFGAPAPVPPPTPAPAPATPPSP